METGSNVCAELLESRKLLSASIAPIRINSGGPAYTDTLGQSWMADKFFSGGSVTNQAYPVANTSDDPLYYSRRWGSFSYNIPTPAATYVVNLYLSESRDTAIGERLFNVFAEGKLALNNVDTYASAGYQTAVIESIKVTATDGVLNLRFANVKDVAIVSAIEVLEVAGSAIPAVPTNVTAVWNTGSTTNPSGYVHVAWDETLAAYYTAAFRVQRSIAGADEYADVDFINSSNFSFDDHTAVADTNYSYRVIAFTSTERSAPSVSASIKPLPAGWTDTDIGAVGFAGEAGVNSTGGMNVSGSGADIFNATDAFNYDYQSLSGDGAIIAQVSFESDTNPWAKAGIMIRENLSANSPFAMLALTPGHGVAFESRSIQSGQTPLTLTSPAMIGIWLKLVRSGDTITAFTSPDNKTWTAYSAVTLALPETVEIGLCVTSHNNSIVNSSTFSNVTTTNTGGVALPLQ